MRYIDLGPRRLLIKDSGEWFNLPEFVHLPTDKGVTHRVRLTGPPYAYFYHLMEVDGHQYVSYCAKLFEGRCVQVAGKHDTKRGYMVPCYDYETGSERVLDITTYEYQEAKFIIEKEGDPTGYDIQLSRITRQPNPRRYHQGAIEKPGPAGEFDDSPLAYATHEQTLANAQHALYRVRKVDARSVFMANSSGWIEEQLTKLTNPKDTMIVSTPEAVQFFETADWEYQLFEV
jgi:hypothetical protein